MTDQACLHAQANDECHKMQSGIEEGSPSLLMYQHETSTVLSEHAGVSGRALHRVPVGLLCACQRARGSLQIQNKTLSQSAMQTHARHWGNSPCSCKVVWMVTCDKCSYTQYVRPSLVS